MNNLRSLYGTNCYYDERTHSYYSNGVLPDFSWDNPFRSASLITMRSAAVTSSPLYKFFGERLIVLTTLCRRLGCIKGGQFITLAWGRLCTVTCDTVMSHLSECRVVQQEFEHREMPFSHFCRLRMQKVGQGGWRPSDDTLAWTSTEIHGTAKYSEPFI